MKRACWCLRTIRKELAAAIATLLDDPALRTRLGRAGRQRCEAAVFAENPRRRNRGPVSASRVASHGCWCMTKTLGDFESVSTSGRWQRTLDVGALLPSTSGRIRCGRRRVRRQRAIRRGPRSYGVPLAAWIALVGRISVGVTGKHISAFTEDCARLRSSNTASGSTRQRVFQRDSWPGCCSVAWECRILSMYTVRN